MNGTRLSDNAAFVRIQVIERFSKDARVERLMVLALADLMTIALYA